jgi:hypothetical protein
MIYSPDDNNNIDAFLFWSLNRFIRFESLEFSFNNDDSLKKWKYLKGHATEYDCLVKEILKYINFIYDFTLLIQEGVFTC